jgi:hypothetical protein
MMKIAEALRARAGRIVKRSALAAVAAALLAPLASNPGHSQVCICACAFPAARITIQLIDSEHDQTRSYFGTALPIAQPPGTESGNGSYRLGKHEDWLIREMFKHRVLPALQMMTEQLVGVMMNQMLITGAFFDAKNQLETELLLQEMKAAAYRDYQPSVTICEFGTAARSLAASSRMSKIGAYALNRQYILRHLGYASNNAGQGPDTDRGGNDGPPSGRLGEFRQRFCDFHDSNRIPDQANTGLFFCDSLKNMGAETSATTNGFANRDIDFGRTVMMSRTINSDLTDSSLDPFATDNAAVIAMSANLYGHDVFKRDKSVLRYLNTNDELIDARAIVAKRAVAQASFNDIISLKMRGSDAPKANPADPGGTSQEGSSVETGSFLKNVMRQLGGPADAWDSAAKQGGANDSDSIDRYMTGMTGTKDYTPAKQMSYFEEMEFMAKKLYQRPEFYTNLYTNPQNLKRQSVAMQAVGLMLDRNMYESHLRSEMLLSMILELKLRPMQDRVQDNLGLLQTTPTAK